MMRREQPILTIPLTDTLGVDRLKNARYSEWVEELSDLVAEFQVRFDDLREPFV